jgi:hypothetical protein
MIDHNTAADRLFGGSTAAPAAPTPPAPTAPAPATQAAAPAQDSDAANMARIEKAFGQPKAEGDAATVKTADGAPAEGLQKPTEAKVADTAPPTFDPKSPETAIVAPVAAELGLSAAQVTKLTELRQTLNDRQANAWHTEAVRPLEQARRLRPGSCHRDGRDRCGRRPHHPHPP